MEEEIPKSKETLDFLKKAGEKPRQFGLNKFQVQIKELEQQILNSNATIQSKDQQLQNFQNNVSIIQQQFQEKYQDHTELQNAHTTIEKELKLVQAQLQLDGIKYTDTIESITQINKDIAYENRMLKSKIPIVSQEYSELNTKYSELKIRYQASLQSFDKKSKEYHELSELYNNLQNQLNLEIENGKNKESKNDSIIVEVVNLKNENSKLRILLFEKDSHLAKITKELNSRPVNSNVGKPKIIEIKEEPKEIAQITTTTELITQTIHAALIPPPKVMKRAARTAVNRSASRISTASADL